MSGLINTVSIRSKLMMLLILALGFTLALTVSVGVSLFVKDKGSYVMDYSLIQVRAAANSVDNQIQKTLLMTRMIHFKRLSTDKAGLDQVFKENAKLLKIKHLLVLNMEKEGDLKPILTFGEEDKALAHRLDQLGWDSVRFLNDPILVAKTSTHDLAIGTFVRSAGGGGAVYVSFVTPDLNLPENLADFHIFLMDSTGDNVATGGTQSPVLKPSNLVNVSKQVLDDKQPSGVKTWVLDGESFLVSYQHLEFKDLTMIGLASDRLAFSAVRTLVSRSIVLGVSMILIVCGIMLLLLRRMTESLRSMSGVIEKVISGVFSFRVDTNGMKNDEIGTLATSFNLMIGKIDELMANSAEKVESKYNLEAVTAVQSSYIPQKAFEHTNISFSGKSIFSHQCGGDWWFHETFDDYVIMVVGKFEGRGLSAALLMSAAHGVLSTFSAVSKSAVSSRVPSLQTLVTQLNSVIYQATQGKQKLSCSITLMDTHTGKTEMINAAHPPPYLHRLEFETKPDDPSQRFEFLPLKKHPALGASSSIKCEVNSFQLQSGDMIFWHTMGLMKTLDSKGEAMSTSKMFQLLAELYDQSDFQATKISTGLIEKLKAFYGEVIQSPPDDITVAVAAVSKKVKFKERDELAA